MSAPSRSAVRITRPPFVLVDQITTLGTNAWASQTPPRTAVSQQRAATPRMVAQAGYSAPVPTPAGMPTRASIQEQLPEGAILVDDDWGVVGNEAIADPAFSGQMMPGEMMGSEMMPGEMMPGEMMPGEMMSGEMMPGANGGYGSYGPACGSSCTHGMACQLPECTLCRVQPPACGPPGWLWVRGEYLAWWASGMSTPPLVTTSPTGTPISQAGVLPAADVLYGNGSILTDASSGYRIRFGGFFGPQRRWGYEAEYFSLGDNTELFTASSDGNGNPILARPFFNVNPLDQSGNLGFPGEEDAELVAYPGLLAGTVAVDSFSKLQSAAGRLKFNLCCNCGNACGDGCCACGYPRSSRLDLLMGYRYYSLDEGLTITEELTSIDAINPGTFDIRDTFETRNSFNGGEIGMTWEGTHNRWTLELLMNVAIGATTQEVSISGETTLAPLVAPAETYEGGLLAQRSNIGNYDRSVFTMIPQLNTNLGYYLTPRLRALVGYSLVYWGSVVRPGDQIDLDVNPALLPPELDPFLGPLRPAFAFHETNYWAQGINVGLDYRW